jgi:subtilisin family serine protease
MRRLLFCCTALLLLIASKSLGQVDQEIVLRVEPNIIDIDSSGSVTINHTGIDSVFSVHPYISISKAWPTYNPSDSLHYTNDGRIIKKPDWSNIFRIEMATTACRDSVIEWLNMYEDVYYAEPNSTSSDRTLTGSRGKSFNASINSLFGRTKQLLNPSDPLYQYQWNLNGTYGINAGAAWDITTGDPSTLIAFVDRPLNNNHPDFSSRLLSTSYGNSSHANLCAGIAIAELDNDLVISGIDGQAGYYGFEKGSDAISEALAIRQAYEAGAHIINCSWGVDPPRGIYETCYPTLALEVTAAYRAGCVVVAADREIGHIGEYPARYGRQGIIVTGATNVDGLSADYFDGYGSDATDYCAPGGDLYYQIDPLSEQITSTWSHQDGGQTVDYNQIVGTSPAAPHVSGLCGLIRATAIANPLNSELDPEDYEEIIRLTCQSPNDPYPDQYEYGAGIVDADAAISFLQPTGQEPNRCLRHFKELYAGGTVTKIGDNLWCLPVMAKSWAWYILDRYRFKCDIYMIERTIAFPVAYTSEPAVWGRGKGAYGFSLDYRPMVPKMYTEVVPGSITSTGATLRTFVYEVHTPISKVHQFWIPCEPADARFAYTVVGDIVEPDEKTLTVYGPDCMSAKEPLTWHAHVNFAGPVSYLWESEVNPGSNNWITIGTHSVCSRLGSYNDFNIRCTATFNSMPWKLSEEIQVSYDPGCVLEMRKQVPNTSNYEDLHIEVISCHPNPLYSRTNIALRIKSPSSQAENQIDVRLFDIYGKEVRTVFAGNLTDGYHEIPVDAGGLPTGSYIYRIACREKKVTGFLSIVK